VLVLVAHCMLPRCLLLAPLLLQGMKRAMNVL
jgi:hypothetical protein